MAMIKDADGNIIGDPPMTNNEKAETKTVVNHIIDKVCSCKHCQMIDVMFGDPLLNSWEREFIDSVIFQGWQKDYSPKQKAVIEKTFNKQKAKYKVK